MKKNDRHPDHQRVLVSPKRGLTLLNDHSVVVVPEIDSKPSSMGSRGDELVKTEPIHGIIKQYGKRSPKQLDRESTTSQGVS
jgi:hypothetical protein